MNWQRQGGVVAWPHGWQRPNKTEEWAYEHCLATAEQNPFVQILCFPWATLVDLQRKGLADKAKVLLDALHWAPPKITLKRVTVMQHIWAKDMLPQLRALGITDVYWSHATRTEAEWAGGIRVHPFPLYPVCCGTDVNPAEFAPADARPSLYGFVGAYEPGLYPSHVRQWIFDLPPLPDARVMRRGEWHLEGPVYREQIEGGREQPEARAIRQAREREYRQILSETVFSLCPSGAGPNSIRLWESLGLGCIPVLLADDLRLPGDERLWRAACVFVREQKDAVALLPGLLQSLAADKNKIAGMRAEGSALWRQQIQECRALSCSSENGVVFRKAGKA